jgi:hypothetical protein
LREQVITISDDVSEIQELQKEIIYKAEPGDEIDALMADYIN